MKKAVLLEFSELYEKVAIELDNSQSPKTVRAIIGSLPCGSVRRQIAVLH